MGISLYERRSNERKFGQEIGDIPDWYTTAGYVSFAPKFLSYPEQTVRGRYQEMADRAGEIATKLYGDLTPRATRWSEEFFSIIWKGYLSPSTPVLGNLGAGRGLPISCTGNAILDSVDSFYMSRYETAILTKNGFGTSSYLGDIRPRGSAISAGGTASGVVPVINGFRQDSVDISQGGVRRGSWAGYLEVEHGDFDEVADLLQHKGDNLNIGWIIGDDFLERLNLGDKEAIRRYKRIMKTRIQTGKGYLFFIDKVNRLAPENTYGKKVKASNLCVSGDTWIDTTSGLRQIKTLTRAPFSAVVDGKNYPASAAWSNGVKSVVEIRTVQGYALRCTPDHSILLKNGVWVEAQDLVPGNKLKVNQHDSFSISNFDDEDRDKGYVTGHFVGNGTVSSGYWQLRSWSNPGDQDVEDRLIAICPPNRLGPVKWTKRNESVGCGYIALNPGSHWADRYGLRSTDVKHNISHLINSESDSFLVGVLQGLFDTDGHVECSADSERGWLNVSVRFGQVNKGLIENVQRILNRFGIRSSIYLLREEGTTWLPDSNRELAEYDTQESWRLVINSKSVQRWIDLIGFTHSEKKKKLETAWAKVKTYNIAFVAEVSEIVHVGEEEVFDVIVDEIHAFSANGLIAHNCNEISLPSDSETSFACVLSSLNLTKFDEWSEDLIFYATVFLDCINEELINLGQHIPGLEKVVRFATKARSLGLGVLGFHTKVQANGWAMDDLRTQYFNAMVFERIDQETAAASAWMGAQAGSPEWVVGNHRNLHRIAVAPTMSTALICGGVSQGIEPLMGNAFTQSSNSGGFNRVNPNLIPVMKAAGVYNNRTILDIATENGSVQHVDWLDDEQKRIFRTAFEIDQMVLIRLASQRQKFIDQGQSLNLFFDESEDPRFISQVHRAAAEDPYIKGLYYLRSQSSEKPNRGDDCVVCEG